MKWASVPSVSIEILVDGVEGVTPVDIQRKVHAIMDNLLNLNNFAYQVSLDPRVGYHDDIDWRVSVTPLARSSGLLKGDDA